MDYVELNDSVHMALLKIHVVTGWVVPQAEFLDVLIEQFGKFLQEKYPTVNPAEVEYAFRHYGTTVKDWGKQMNLGLIDEVLIPYLEQRREISDKEQQKSVKMIEHKEDLSDQAMEDWIKTLKNESRVDFMPPMIYDWLEKKGRINYTNAEKWASVQRAIKFTMGKPDYAPEMTEKTLINNLAKKFLLMDYINESKCSE